MERLFRSWGARDHQSLTEAITRSPGALVVRTDPEEWWNQAKDFAAVLRIQWQETPPFTFELERSLPGRREQSAGQPPGSISTLKECPPFPFDQRSSSMRKERIGASPNGTCLPPWPMSSLSGWCSPLPSKRFLARSRRETTGLGNGDRWLCDNRLHRYRKLDCPHGDAWRGALAGAARMASPCHEATNDLVWRKRRKGSRRRVHVGLPSCGFGQRLRYSLRYGNSTRPKHRVGGRSSASSHRDAQQQRQGRGRGLLR